jgi:hypothetical protein
MIKHRSQLHEICNIKLPAVEVGCAEGYFSADLLYMGFVHLYMVDAWQTLNVSGDGSSPQSWHDSNYEKAMNRVKTYRNLYKVLRGLSVEMAAQIPDNSLGLVYLDAGHDYDSVMADLNAYYPKLVKGGIMAGHDYLNTAYGVKKAVTEFAKKHGFEVHVIPEHKDEDAGFWFKV